MNQLDAEQIVAQGKANVSSAFELSAKLLDSIVKLTELNLQAAKSGLSESRETVDNLLSARTPHEWLTLNASHVYPTLQKSFAYTRHVLAIASDTRGEFDKVIDSHYKSLSDNVDALVDSAGESVPPGAEASIAALKSVIAAANKAYDTLREANRQASKAVEDHLSAAAEAVAHAEHKNGTAVVATTATAE
jgi:phasin family protein